jgi:hypothetical protein
MPSLS